MKLRREITFSGAYDFRAPNSNKNYGIHGMEIQFAVIGDAGAITMTIYTNWHLPHVGEELLNNRYYGDSIYLPNITDISYHAKEAQYSGHSPVKNCKYTGGDCYCDGSGLWGNEAWRLGFLHGGTEWLWPRMEQYYRHLFEGGALPDLTPVPRPHPNKK